MRRKQTFTDKIIKVETINQLHSFAGIGEPRHPLVSIIDYSRVDTTGGPASGRFMLGFYWDAPEGYIKTVTHMPVINEIIEIKTVYSDGNESCPLNLHE